MKLIYAIEKGENGFIELNLKIVLDFASGGSDGGSDGGRSNNDCCSEWVASGRRGKRRKPWWLLRSEG